MYFDFEFWGPDIDPYYYTLKETDACEDLGI